MTKLEQMRRIEACGIVAIIRANSANELIDAARGNSRRGC